MEQKRKLQLRLPISGAVDNAGNPDVILFNAVHDAIGAIDNFPAVLVSDFWDSAT